MNDDFENELEIPEEDPYRCLSNTNCILQAINDLSKKMDDAQKESEKKKDSVFRSRSPLQYYHFLLVLSPLLPECLL